MTAHTESCPFCARIERGEVEQTTVAAIVSFEPLNPVANGHRLFVPTSHVRDFRSAMGAVAVGAAMRAAAEWAAEEGGDANLIVSAGPGATQTVRHLHVHYVPRLSGDGLHLPWTGQA